MNLQGLFLTAGVWNVLTGILYLGLRVRIASRFGVGTGPDPTDRILANLLHVYFGIAAFWIAQDPQRDMHLILLWAATKTTSVILAGNRFARAEQRSWVTLLPAGTDLVWASAFVWSWFQLTN